MARLLYARRVLCKPWLTRVLDMPELPEAETIARELQGRLAGCMLGKVHVARRDIVHGHPKPLEKALPGRRIERVRRRAKRIVFDLNPPAQLVFHLGMSGRLDLCDVGQAIEKHTHLRITIRRTGRELRFLDARRFGGVWFLAGGDEHVGRRLREPGPEPLELTPARFARLVRRPRQIKALLLDQQTIAGLGNIYCDEALHAAGIHPLTKADDLDPARAGRLLRAIKTTLRRAIRYRGSTFSSYRRPDGSTGSFQRYHCVYGRAGQPCRRCGTEIERLIVAGRSTFICPDCQDRR